MKNLVIMKNDFEVYIEARYMTKWFKIYIKNHKNEDFSVLELSDIEYIFDDIKSHYYVMSTLKNTLSMRKFIESNINDIFERFQNERVKYIFGL